MTAAPHQPLSSTVSMLLLLSCVLLPSLGNAGLITRATDQPGGGTPSKPVLHDFDAVLLNSWRSLLDVTFSGLLNGATVYAQTIQHNPDGAVWFEVQGVASLE